jgi:hypothetical protein
MIFLAFYLSFVAAFFKLLKSSPTFEIFFTLFVKTFTYFVCAAMYFGSFWMHYDFYMNFERLQ